MQYVILIYDEGTADPSSVPDDPAMRQQTHLAYNAYTKMLQDRGAMRAGEALQPATTATTVRVRDGETVMTDGPFAETKEALGGFYLIDAADLDEALKLAAACPGATYGSIEVRPIVELMGAGGAG
ncbi:MAG TPA: YciI family protein [Candidatus Limnocylindrales bacterium]|jgi:hypothetical protein